MKWQRVDPRYHDEGETDMEDMFADGPSMEEIVTEKEPGNRGGEETPC